MSVKKRLLKNGISSLFLRLVTISEQFLLVPIFISAWGADYYGEWLTLTIIPSIVGLLDVGFGLAVANTFILNYVSGNKQAAANTYKSGMFTLHLIVFLSMLVAFVFVFTLNYFDIFDKLLIPKNEAIIAVSILIFSKIILFYKQLFDAIFVASRKFNISVNLQAIYSTLLIISSVIILLFKGGIVLFSLVNLIVTLFYVFIYAIIAKRILPLKSFNGQVVVSEIKNLFKVGIGYLLAKVWEAIFFQGTTFVVRVVLGPIAVTIFNTVRKLSRTIFQVNTLVVSSVMPELQYALGKRQFNQARKLFRFNVFIVLLMSVLGVLLLISFGSWFYQVWTRKELAPPNVMWYVFIFGIVFNSLWAISSEVILAANKPYSFTIPATVMAIVSILISYIFALKFGLSGVAIGSLVMDITLCMYLLPFSCRLLHQPLNEIFSTISLDFKI
ncbi:lipopolysaccharide biosynthesis protein [Flavobacterium restrictum]|uniref:Na+-driven multidrug efflux pump n=1 Tax=Flavobacterium restrictum TaxID=2594428 RepID=A0A553E573_9FLAO|nr:hypothetical protein [Flavobacterium restrictum]TRX40112.1 hypothetical protein FNW21_07845 [Flavobacterium restrictum]